MIMMKPFSSNGVLFFISTLFLFVTFTFSSNEGVVVVDGLKNYQELRLPGNLTGPESLAFDCHGNGPYIGVSDGRILKWEPTNKTWIEFAVNSPKRDRKLCDGSSDVSKEHLCGRPLGLKFNNKTCDLYIADSYFGLLVVGPNGGVAQTLATSADDGVPFKFLNGLDVDDQTGEIYFSDSSRLYQRREFMSVIQTKDKSGRLLKYDPRSKKVHVLLQGLAFANGVALSQDASFVLVTECTLGRIQKFWLKGSKPYTSQLLLQLERATDNIKKNNMGNFWVSQISNTNTTNHPIQGDPVAVKFDDQGKILQVLDGKGGQQLHSVSEVLENNQTLWVGSSSKPYVAFLN